jgi:nitroimidazol reductase NimA-like FMN-containing flavoprotein (pyridoxamine 5'-phosphate oxidase superfamily)
MSVRLTEDEAWAFVAASTTAIVTTLRRDGFPITLPTWFVVIDRAVYLRTPDRSKKVARIRHDNRAGVLVESGAGWSELKAVSFAARAELVTDEEVRAQVLTMLGDKYRGRRQSRKTLPDSTVRHYATGEAIIRLAPVDRLLTWDNAKVPLTTEGSAK